MTDLPPDDDRTWYAVGAKPWATYQIYQAAHARAAVAEHRRKLTAAELSTGKPLAEVRRDLTAADLRVVAGPLRTREAFQLELADAYAAGLAHWRDAVDTVPLGAPIELGGTKRIADQVAEEAAAIRARILARYLPDPEG